MTRIPRGRGVPAALTLALVAFFAFVTLATAERSTHPVGETTEESFAAACDERGGQLIEMTDAFDIVLESRCTYKDGGATSCDWFLDTCTTEWPRRPARIRGPIGDVPSGGLLDAPDGPRFRPTGGTGAAQPGAEDREISREILLVLSKAAATPADGAAPVTLTPKLNTPILVPEGDGGGVVTVQPVTEQGEATQP